MARVLSRASALPSEYSSIPILILTYHANYFHRERAASQLQLISDLADLTVPASALGWVNFDDGVVGLAGTLSSVIGVYSQWKKTA